LTNLITAASRTRCAHLREQQIGLHVIKVSLQVKIDDSGFTLVNRLSLSFAKILSGREINSLRDFLTAPSCYNSRPCPAGSGSGSEL